MQKKEVLLTTALLRKGKNRSGSAPGSLCLRIFTLAIVLYVLGGCVPRVKVPITEPEKAFEVVDPTKLPLEEDDLTVSSFIRALDGSIQYYQKIAAETVFRFGTYQVSCRELRTAFTELERYARDHPLWPSIAEYIRDHFICLRAKGYRGNGKLLFTGYYEPSVKGSLAATPVYRYPLYRIPPDLVYVDLSLFGNSYPTRKLTGRLLGRRVVPYYTRREIDFEGKLRGRNLELVWLPDIVDTFFVHVQGSAEIVLGDGTRMNVNYAASNGHPYKSIGALLIKEGKVPKDQMSMGTLRDYLHNHPDEIERVLSHNPSYVFFRTVKEGPVGSLGLVLTPLRSIATDHRFYPPGALAFIRILPSPHQQTPPDVPSKTFFNRFVLVQDRGGAIKGAGRVDYYWGKGTKAAFFAGSFKPWGNLFLFVPKN